jgi:hypothetical protein
MADRCKPANKNALMELEARQNALLEKHPHAPREKTVSRDGF